MIRPLPCVFALALSATPALAGVTALDEAAVAHPAAPAAIDAAALVTPDPLITVTPRLVQPWAGGTVVRLTQSLSGIQVENRELIVVLGIDGEVRRTRGEPVPPTWLDTTPSLGAHEAIPIAETAVVPLWGRTPVGTPRTELRAAIDRDEQAHLVWAVDLRLADPPSNWRILVDAHDGTLRRTSRTSWDADGNVYPANPANSDPERVELPNLLSDDWLDGTYATVNSCETWEESGGNSIFGGGECTSVAPHVVPDGDGHYLYSIDAASLDDPMAEVQMYYHLDKVAAWFDDELGFAHGESIEGIVNFEYRNAFFGDADDDGEGEVAFGQFSSTDFAYDSDVIAHEFGHSVISRVVQAAFIGADEYGLEWAPGALNEGSADLFSATLYLDPQLGEYAGAGFGNLGPVRDVEADRNCPEHLYGEVHRDGLIWGSMGWNMQDDPSIGPELTATVVFGAVLTWPSDITWAGAGDSVLESADDLLAAGEITEEQRTTIEAHLTTSGLVGCERVVRLDDGAEPTQLLINGGLSGEFARVPAGAQLSIDAPEGTRDIRFRVREWRTTTDEMGWAVYVRRGDHIVHDLTTLLGFDFPVPAIYDFVIEGSGDGVDIELGEDTDPPLEPGATYYFSLASTNLGGLPPLAFTNAEITVSGDKRVDEGDDDDASGDDDDGGDGCSGCASSVGGAHPRGLGLLLIAALSLLARRPRPGRRTATGR